LQTLCFVHASKQVLVADKHQKGKVKKIMELKKQNPQADTTDLETQIDQLVYALYGLTEDEIKIVEQS